MSNNMETEILQDEIFIKAEFKKRFKGYKNHLKEAEAIKDYNEVQSDSFLDFVPFASEINQSKKHKIFSKLPKQQDGKIVSRFLNDRIFYAFQFNQKNLGSEFYLYGENTKTRLKYDDQNMSDKILLSQICHIVFENELVQKVISYMPDEDMGDTFMVDKYVYDDQKRVKNIFRKGYYENENDTHNFDECDRTFRFDYENNKVLIFSKQLKLNGENRFELIFPRK